MIKFSYKDAILNKIPKIEIKPIIEEYNSLNNNIQNISNIQDKLNSKLNYNIVEEDEYEDESQDESNKKEESKKQLVVKKKIHDIFVKKDSIIPKEDMIKLCSHGMYKKINLINNSHFNDENVSLYIKHMYNKIDEIKKWKTEPSNNNQASKKRFKNRINCIYKTINLIKNKHLDYISDTIVNNNIPINIETNDNWVKMNKTNNI
jgi:hypothetical protein